MEWRKSLKADDGKVIQVLEFSSGAKVEIPLTKTGEVKWFDDEKLRRKMN